MNRSQLHKLHSAAAPVANKAAEKMSGNVRFCPNLSASKHEKCKTKPMSPRQCRALELMIGGCTDRKTAEIIGVNDRTIRRWKQDARFTAKVQQRFARADVAVHKSMKMKDRDVDDFDDLDDFEPSEEDRRECREIMGMLGIRPPLDKKRKDDRRVAEKDETAAEKKNEI